MFIFRNLDAWKVAMSLSNRVYSLTKTFPVDEKFGLTSQIRRAVVSVAANIAEGSGRGSKKDFNHFLNISFGSLCETVTLLEIALHQRYLDNAAFSDVMTEMERIGQLLTGLRRSLKQ